MFRTSTSAGRWHKSFKGECIRPATPLSLEDARRLVQGYLEHYKNVRLNSAVGCNTPKDMLARRQQEIHAEGDRMRIPMMPISQSDLMPISSERSDAGLPQCESVIGIRQDFSCVGLVFH
jgi:hypothetical protein